MPKFRTAIMPICQACSLHNNIRYLLGKSRLARYPKNIILRMEVPRNYIGRITGKHPDTKNSKSDVKNDMPTGVADGIPTGAAAEISDKSNNCDNKLQKYLFGLYNDYKGIESPKDTIMYAIGVFLTNYFELKDADTHGADKYFHARANYESAQQGIVGELAAKIISDLRELTDGYRNIREKGYNKNESEKDIKEDQNANLEGRILGRKHPLRPAYEILKHLMPNGFPERYRKK